MSELFSRQLEFYEKSTTRVRNHYRTSGSLERQDQIILKRLQGTRALIFAKIWYDERGAPTRQQESELREADDRYIIKRTYTFDLFGNPSDGVVERITLRRPKIQGLPSAPLFDDPDAALRKLLERKPARQGELPPPPDLERSDEPDPQTQKAPKLSGPASSTKKK